MNLFPTVLLVEDSADDTYFFRRALKNAQAECTFWHVADGAAAVKLLNEARSDPGKMPDIIFLDLKMPVLNGFEVLNWLRARPTVAWPEIVILSGSDQDEDKAQAAELGAAGYLVKPVSSESLRNWLNKPGGKRRRASES